MRRPIPAVVRAAIETGAMELVDGSYRRFHTVGGREPCVTVGLVTDYLRQAHMPEDFHYATKDRQRSWVRSTLEAMRRKGQLGSSMGARQRCYEPAPGHKSKALLDAEIAEAIGEEPSR